MLLPEAASAEQAMAFVEAWLEQAQTPMKTAHKLMIAVDEIYSNIARYSGAGRVIIRCAQDERGITLQFLDDGAPYDPLAAPDPDVTSGAQEREIGGLGIFVVRKLMDEVCYRREENRNVLTIRKA